MTEKFESYALILVGLASKSANVPTTEVVAKTNIGMNVVVNAKKTNVLIY